MEFENINNGSKLFAGDNNFFDVYLNSEITVPMNTIVWPSPVVMPMRKAI